MQAFPTTWSILHWVGTNLHIVRWLYTKCIQFYTYVVGKITPVIHHLSPVCTAPITKTTTYIY